MSFLYFQVTKVRIVEQSHRVPLVTPKTDWKVGRTDLSASNVLTAVFNLPLTMTSAVASKYRELIKCQNRDKDSLNNIMCNIVIVLRILYYFRIRRFS